MEASASNAERTTQPLSLAVTEGGETPLFRFDTNDQDGIQFGEVLGAIQAFNDDEPVGGEPATFQDVIRVITAFNDGSGT